MAFFWFFSRKNVEKWPILQKNFLEFWPKWPNFAFRYFQMAKNWIFWKKWPKTSFVLIFEKIFRKIFLKFFAISIPKPWLKRPKMTQKQVCFDFWKKFSKNFWKFFFHFYTKTMAKTAKNGPKWPQISILTKFIDFWETWFFTDLTLYGLQPG